MKSLIASSTIALLALQVAGCSTEVEPTSEDVSNQSAATVAKTFEGRDADALIALLAKVGYRMRPNGPAGGSDSSSATARNVSCVSSFLRAPDCYFENRGSLRGDDALSLVDFMSRAGIRGGINAPGGGGDSVIIAAKFVSCRVDFLTRSVCTIEGQGSGETPRPAVDPVSPGTDLEVDARSASLHLSAGDKKTLSFYLAERKAVSVISEGTTQVALTLYGPDSDSRKISLAPRTEHGTPDLTNDIIKRELDAGVYYVTVQTVSPRAGGDTKVKLVSGLVETLVLEPNLADW